jgi:hypothetical protein
MEIVQLPAICQLFAESVGIAPEVPQTDNKGSSAIASAV